MSVFVSFDWDNDKKYKFLLEAWDANRQFDFRFDDGSAREIYSHNISRVKGALTTKINDANHTLVLIGAHANQIHRDQQLIGHRNWINFEIAQSKASGNHLVAVRLSPGNVSPDEILLSGADWAIFTKESISKALYGY